MTIRPPRHALGLLLVGALAVASAAAQPAPVVRPTVVATLPHDTTASTQGLLVFDGHLYESTGGRGASTLRRADPATGRVLASRALGPDLFAEGLAALGDRLFQLTWTSGLALVWDREPLAPLDTLRYRGEGWGLAADGGRLVMSDGSDTLRWRDPVTFAETRSVRVHDGGAPVVGLNELEVVGGLVLANVRWSGRIAAVDPATGAVAFWLDLRDVFEPHYYAGRGDLNGVAYDAGADRLLVTGKRWPVVYVLEGFRPSAVGCGGAERAHQLRPPATIAC